MQMKLDAALRLRCAVAALVLGLWAVPGQALAAGAQVGVLTCESVAGTRFNVRVPAEFVKPEDIQRLQLGVRDGRPIYLADVAAIRDTFKDPTSFSRLDGRGSLTVSVQKRIGENIIRIADEVRRIVREFQARSPKGMEFKITLDQSDDIRMMNSDLENNIFTGLVLVMGVLVLFMGLLLTVGTSLM